MLSSLRHRKIASRTTQSRSVSQAHMQLKSAGWLCCAQLAAIACGITCHTTSSIKMQSYSYAPRKADEGCARQHLQHSRLGRKHGYVQRPCAGHSLSWMCEQLTAGSRTRFVNRTGHRPRVTRHQCSSLQRSQLCSGESTGAHHAIRAHGRKGGSNTSVISQGSYIGD